MQNLKITSPKLNQRGSPNQSTVHPSLRATGPDPSNARSAGGDGAGSKHRHRSNRADEGSKVGKAASSHEARDSVRAGKQSERKHHLANASKAGETMHEGEGKDEEEAPRPEVSVTSFTAYMSLRNHIEDLKRLTDLYEEFDDVCKGRV